MVRHILLLAPQPHATPAAIEEIRQGLASLVGVVPGLVDFHWGQNFAAPHRIQGYTHGFTMDLESRAALDAYATHPAHVAVAEKVRALFSPILVLDLDLAG